MPYQLVGQILIQLTCLLPVASKTGFSQCISGSGVEANLECGMINDSGLILANLNPPVTFELWIKTDVYPDDCHFLEIIAGSMMWRAYVQATVIDVIVHVYNNAATPTDQDCHALYWNADGYVAGDWLHIAYTLDTTRTGLYSGGASEDTPLQIYFNGVRANVDEYAPGGGVKNGWRHISYSYQLVAGRGWDPSAPTSNLMALAGCIDELRVSNIVRYTGASDIGDWILY